MTRRLSAVGRTALFAGAAALTVTAVHAQPAAVVQFDADVAKAVKAWKTPGLAIVVVRNDTVLFAKGYVRIRLCHRLGLTLFHFSVGLHRQLQNQ